MRQNSRINSRRRQRSSAGSIRVGSGLKICRINGRWWPATRATSAANAEPRFGSSSWSQALHQQTICGASPRSFGQLFRRASTILASDVFQTPTVL
jgi:hypothetical protein